MKKGETTFKAVLGYPSFHVKHTSKKRAFIHNNISRRQNASMECFRAI